MGGVVGTLASQGHLKQGWGIVLPFGGCRLEVSMFAFLQQTLEE